MLGEAHVDLAKPRTALARYGAVTERALWRNRHRGRIEPNVAAAYEVLERSRNRRRIAIRTRLEVRPGRVVTELNHRNRKTAVNGQDGVVVPAAEYGIHRLGRVGAKRPAMAERNVIVYVAGQRVSHVGIAVTIVQANVVDILLERNIRRSLRYCRVTIPAVVTLIVGKTLTPGVVDLESKSLGEALLRHHLQSLVVLDSRAGVEALLASAIVFQR